MNYKELLEYINSFYFENIHPTMVRIGLDKSSKALLDLYAILAFAIPISLLFYLIFDRYKHKILVDLGHHKWIIKFK
jgi:hypothetical protein